MKTGRRGFLSMLAAAVMVKPELPDLPRPSPSPPLVMQPPMRYFLPGRFPVPQNPIQPELFASVMTTFTFPSVVVHPAWDTDEPTAALEPGQGSPVHCFE